MKSLKDKIKEYGILVPGYKFDNDEINFEISNLIDKILKNQFEYVEIDDETI